MGYYACYEGEIRLKDHFNAFADFKSLLERKQYDETLSAKERENAFDEQRPHTFHFSRE